MVNRNDDIYDKIGKELFTFCFSNGINFSIEALTIKEAMAIYKKTFYENAFKQFNFKTYHNTDYRLDDDGENPLFTFVFSDNTVYSCTALDSEEAMDKIDTLFNENAITIFAHKHFEVYRNLKYVPYQGSFK